MSARGKHGPPHAAKCPSCREWRNLTVGRLVKKGTASWHMQTGRAKVRVSCSCGHEWDSQHPQLVRRVDEGSR